MKRIFIMIGLLVSLASCKNNTDADINEEKVADSVSVDVETPDYAKLGMKAEGLPQGLQIGDKVPAVVFVAEDGTRTTLESLYDKQPVVVIFYRGEWCPVCIKHLSEFTQEAKKIEEKGAKLVAITPEKYEKADITREKTGADFTIISDSDGKIMEAFEVDFDVREDYQAKIDTMFQTSIATSNSSGKAVLPVPATYIIDTNGKVVYRQFNPNYRNRASVQDIIDHLPEKK